MSQYSDGKYSISESITALFLHVHNGRMEDDDRHTLTYDLFDHLTHLI